MKEIKIDATIENLSKVFESLKEVLDSLTVKPQIKRQVKMCVEEIYVNISNYAYSPEVGKAKINFDIVGEDDSARIVISFYDSGKPYDPLMHDDPDMEADLDEAPIGGLGIYLVKNTMDTVKYESKDGLNILTMEKVLS